MVAYSDDMETRVTRKRRWQSSPDKRTARASLDFSHAENTPPRKRRALACSPSTNSSTTDTDSQDDESKESFNTKSFYGGREKKHFPHSPRRRKAASKILAKISNENVKSDKEWISFQKNEEIFSDKGSDRASHSESELSESSASSLSVLRPRTRRQTLGSVSSNTSKHAVVKSPAKAKSSTVDSARVAVTPANNGKKFFKHKSPASADKAVGSVIIRKGFDLKFVPKRNSTTPAKNVKKNSTPKTKVVKNILSSSGKKPTYRPMKNVPWKCDITASNTVNNKSTHSVCSSALSEDLSSASSIGSVEQTDVKGDNSEGSLDLFSATSDVASGCSTPLSDNLTTDKESICSGPSLRKKESSSTPTQLSSHSSNNKKYFAIFNSQNSPKSSPSVDALKTETRSPARRSPRNISRVRYSQHDDEDQMILDAGQKKFGATQCEECGMVYTHADPTDETTHAKFHQSLLNALKFPGWKKERIVQEYPMDGSRVLMVNYDDPKYAIRKVEEINKIMGQEMGFPEPTLTIKVGYKAFLYISEEKRIEGCCLAEPVAEGYRVIADSQPSQSSQPGHRPWCCQSTPEPAAVGISRIWVYGQQRRKGVATKLLDSVRQWFEYGVFIEKDKMAFSDPTPDGKQLATRYTGTPTFLVYKYG